MKQRNKYFSSKYPGSAPVLTKRSAFLTTQSFEIGRYQPQLVVSRSFFTCIRPFNGHNRELNRGLVHVNVSTYARLPMHPSTYKTQAGGGVPVY